MVLLENFETESRDLLLKEPLLEISACQDSDAKIKSDDGCFKKSYSGKQPSTKTLIKEMVHVVLDETELQHPAKVKLFELFVMQVNQKEVFQQKPF